MAMERVAPTLESVRPVIIFIITKENTMYLLRYLIKLVYVFAFVLSLL